MKKITILSFIYLLSGICAFSQDGDHDSGGDFLKRIENNRFYFGSNLNGKGAVERLLLGDFNAPTEFFFDPCAEMREKPSALRIMKDSTTKANILIYKTFRNTDTKGENKEIENFSFTVSDQFAEKIYKKMVSLIENFKSKDEFDEIILDGYFVTFRVVVEAEVWSLNIHEPSGNALKMSDLCRQILKDANSKKLDEAKYIKILEGYNFERKQ